ncbi:acetyltransferase [Alkalilimnicola sp. S0819]|nr:acetyltransferase [Alkalilimnicola sp. S0819]KAB7628233.1 acetyltransferase [Alkalilimnicola sp. S0819]MPQ15124.1 acetyltransferase [Alkalilimnicola sp. S0819]
MSKRARVVVLGAGGHARVLVDALACAGREVAGALDPAMAMGVTPHGLEILGADDWLENAGPDDVQLVNGLGANPDTGLRRAVYEKWTRRGFSFTEVRHPGALVARSARLGAGAQIMAGAVVQAAASLADNVVINTGAIIEHDASLGAHVFVAPGAILCGAVDLGEGVFIGAGAVVLPGRTVGPGAMVAAGAIVNRDVAAGRRVYGSPARERTGTASPSTQPKSL